MSLILKIRRDRQWNSTDGSITDEITGNLFLLISEIEAGWLKQYSRLATKKFMSRQASFEPSG